MYVVFYSYLLALFCNKAPHVYHIKLVYIRYRQSVTGGHKSMPTTVNSKTDSTATASYKLTGFLHVGQLHFKPYNHLPSNFL